MRPSFAIRCRFFSCRLLLAGSLLAANSAYAQRSGEPPGQDLAAALGGGWTRSGSCDRPVQFRLAGKTLLVVGTDGKIDTQRVLERRAAGIATETTASAHGNPIGMRWVYEIVVPGQLSLTDQRGQSATFQRCRPPIPATASPAEFLRGLFAVYVDGADASLPFASETGMRAFLAPDLADAIARYAAQPGHSDTACLRAEPITGAQDDYKVTDVHVTAAEPGPATPDQTSGTVSFRNMGAPAIVRFDLRRTAAGWRIDDLQAGTNASLRAQMAPCTAAH